MRRSLATRRARAGWAGTALLALAGCAGCVTEEDPGALVVLPPEAFRYERFIESPTELNADRVVIKAVRAYRRDLAPVIDERHHSKEMTPDRLRLVNLGSSSRRIPVRLSFRNMQIKARERIEVIFSDAPLLRGFYFHAAPSTEIYALSIHGAVPV